jgi:hypothetical protein
MKPAKSETKHGKLSKGIRSMISNRDAMPSSAFLLPGEKKYPVKVKDSRGRWVYDANMLLAAERRAITQGRADIAHRAHSLYQSLTAKK